MNSILNDASKFENLSSVEENNNTLTTEKRIQRRLLELLNGNIIQQAVYLDDIVRICADTLNCGKFIPPDFPKAVFIELMQIAASGVEFSFNNTMYRQTDGYRQTNRLWVVR